MNRRVVVTAAEGVSALGHEWASVRSNLRAQNNAVRFMQEWERFPDLKTRLAAPIDDFELPEHFGKKKTRAMGRVAKFAVSAVDKALRAADLLDNGILQSGATGVSFGSATGSSEAAMEFFALLENGSMDRVNGTTYLRMMSHTAPVNIAVTFGLSGRCYTTTSACTAGSQGIGYAFEAIRSGVQTVMIAGGSEELCPTQAAVFDTMFATSRQNQGPKKSPRPFDSDRDGLVLGEGAAALVLEEREFALARGAPILAEVLGFGTNMDGRHLVRPNTTTQAEVMRMALRDAGLEPQAIDFISGHGTATVHGDIAEAQSTQEVFGSTVPMATLKSYIGHTLGACGALEAWWTINMMREGWLAPTLNLQSIDSRCRGLNYLQDELSETRGTTFISNNFAFGGINTALIFKVV